MKFINQNASVQLYDRVEELAQVPHESWRAIYLKLSDKPVRHNNELRKNFVVHAITKLMSGIEGTIYLCDDGDIFILFQGLMKSVITKLGGHFAELDTHNFDETYHDSLFYTYDLGKNLDGLHTVCEAKYLEALAKAEESRTKFTYFPDAAAQQMLQQA